MTDVKLPAACTCCGMVCAPGEFHPYAACCMFKGCHDGDTVRANLKFVHEQGRLAGLEAAAKVCEAEYQRIIALQKPGAYGSTEEAVNTNLRMTAVMLPECANAIRALAASGAGK